MLFCSSPDLEFSTALTTVDFVGDSRWFIEREECRWGGGSSRSQLNWWPDLLRWTTHPQPSHCPLFFFPFLPDYSSLSGLSVKKGGILNLKSSWFNLLQQNANHEHLLTSGISVFEVAETVCGKQDPGTLKCTVRPLP